MESSSTSIYELTPDHYDEMMSTDIEFIGVNNVQYHVHKIDFYVHQDVHVLNTFPYVI